MRKSLAILFLVLPTLLAFSPQKDTTEQDPATQARLVGLCRLWGMIKYHHPHLPELDLDWDQALIATIPRVEQARTREAYRRAIDFLLTQLKDPATRTLHPRPKKPTNPAQDREQSQPYLKWVDKNTALIVARDYAAITAASFPLATARFRQVVATGSSARALVFDLRQDGNSQVNTPDEIDEWTFAWVFRAMIPYLLEHDLVISAPRYRFHDGYSPNFNQHLGLYSSGYKMDQHPVLRSLREPRKDGEPKPELVFLVNNGSREIFAVLAGIQAAGLGRVIHSGPPPELAARTHTIKLPMGLEVAMRVSDMINPDCSAGLIPDLKCEHPGHQKWDPARDLAIAVAQKKLPLNPPARTTHALTPGVQEIEDPYPETPYPSREMRLLALFRFWTVIDKFFPYKHLLDRPWSQVLTNFIPRFANAPDELSYHLLTAELVAAISDTHGFIQSPALDRYFGTLHPPLRIRFIEDQPVITFVAGQDAESSWGVKRGDLILAVDDEKIPQRRKRLAPYIAAATPQALRSRLAQVLLAGQPGTFANLKIRTGEGKERTITIPRFLSWLDLERLTTAARPGPACTITPEGYGYMDLVRLSRPEIDPAFEGVRKTPALIFDLRGYPRGTAWVVAPRLPGKSKKAALVFKPQLQRPHMEVLAPTFSFDQPVLPMEKWKYQGRIVVLINEEAISQAEHTCLFLKSAARDITFIGSPTNGANGDLTNLFLPGGICVHFSGQGVRHGDGSRLQRLGIQPDIKIVPTISGIRGGKDEVMEKARKFLDNSGKMNK